MPETLITIDAFCDLILETWGSFRDNEKVMNGVKNNFKHLKSEELEKLWFFLKDKSDKINIPTVKNITKLAKDHSFVIRKPSNGRVISKYVCGKCGHENNMFSTHCTAEGCRHNLTNLPKECLCGFKYPDNTEDHPGIFFGRCQKCKLPRVPGWVKRIMV